MRLRRRGRNGGDDSNGEAVAMAMGDGDGEWALGSGKIVHASLEGKTEDTFPVRKRRPYIHANRI